MSRLHRIPPLAIVITTTCATALLAGLARAQVPATVPRAARPSPGGAQVVAIGSVLDSSASVLDTRAVAGGSVSQDRRNAVPQEVLVGSLRGVESHAARASATLTASVSQLAGQRVPPGDLQRVAVADMRDARASTITTSGALAGSVTQSALAARQRIEIGSVEGTAGAGQVSTRAIFTGSASQVAQSAMQEFLVATVQGGTPTLAEARGTVIGAVAQTAIGTQRSTQRILVADIAGSSGIVRTDATVTAALTQFTGGVGAELQQVLVGSVEDTHGVVGTRVVVGGPISQSATGSVAGQVQRVEIGHVRGTGALAVRTDVSVGGGVTQTQSTRSREAQSVLIGGVLGSGR